MSLTQCVLTFLVFVVSNLTVFYPTHKFVSFVHDDVFDTIKTFLQNVFPMHTAHAFSHERWHFPIGAIRQGLKPQSDVDAIMLSAQLSTSVIALQTRQYKWIQVCRESVIMTGAYTTTVCN